MQINASKQHTNHARQSAGLLIRTLEKKVLTDNAVQFHFRLYGEGMGDKSFQLAAKIPAMKEAGAEINPRQVIGMSLVFEHLEKCGAWGAYIDGKPGEEIREIVKSAPLGTEIRQAISEISESLGGYRFLAIRSDAKGDATGTGAYQSFYSLNDSEQIERHVKGVLMSYFSQDALLFRKDAKLAEGIAVLIEPVVGQEMEFYQGFIQPEKIIYYGPVLSGFGRTDSPEGPFVHVAHGLAAYLMEDPKEGLTVREYFVEGSLEEMTHQDGSKNSLSFTKPLFLNRDGVRCRGDGHGGHWRDAELSGLFRIMEKLQQATGVQQYFEFAMVIENGAAKYYLTQIADRKPVKITFNMKQGNEQIIGIGKKVLNGGDASSQHVMLMHSRGGWGRLHEMNEKLSDYVFLFTSNSYEDCDLHQIRYSFLNNAKAIGFVGSEGGLKRFGAHLGGLLALTGKPIVAFEKFDFEKLEKNAKSSEFFSGNGWGAQFNDIRVFEIPVRLVASEEKKKALLLLNA